ncbi:MAG: glycosyltransferase family 2 protein [bacterium]|nr:glycosyltransferase family 2 protein [bacterium]
MKTSIIIPTYNNVALTKKCLEALKDNTSAKYLDDVIIVDNASTDGTVGYLKSTDWIKAVLNKQNLGFARACNQGAKKAGGDALVFLNNDTEVQRGWLEPLLEKLSGEKVAIASPKMIFPNGKIQHAGIVVSNDYIPRHLYYNEDPDKESVNKTREFQAVTAACMAIKKDVFEEAGGFDDGYVNGMEDIDLCFKVKKLGYRIFYCSDSLVIHHESVSEGRYKATNKNEEIFLKKWKGGVIPDEERYYREDGFSRFFIADRNLKNRFLVSSGAAKKKSTSFRVARIVYISVYRLVFAIKLLLTLDFKTLSKKIRKVRDARG